MRKLNEVVQRLNGKVDDSKKLRIKTVGLILGRETRYIRGLDYLYEQSWFCPSVYSHVYFYLVVLTEDTLYGRESVLPV